MKLSSILLLILIFIPLISFATDNNGGLFYFLNFISEQISILREKIVELIQRIKSTTTVMEEITPSESVVDKKGEKEKKLIAPAPQPLKKETPISIPTPFSPPVIFQPIIKEPQQKEAPKTQLFPRVDLKANGSDGPVTITRGDVVTLSWNLSDHNWSYCGKLGGWDGTLSIENGSLSTEPLSYNKTYNLFCYIGSDKYEDSVSIDVVEPKKEEPKLSGTTSVTASSTYSATPNGGFKSCSLEVSKPFVTLGKDAIEATWTIDSDPRSAFFYWRGKDNGVDIGRVYGGKTLRVRTYDYGGYSVKYERYVEMVLDSDHIIGDPFIPGCTTNTVTFEIKQ